jgi:hypothetical protein
MPESCSALLLHLDHEQSASAAKHEIELVPPGTRIGVEKSVPAKSVVAENAPLPAIHAAEGLAERASSVGFHSSLCGNDAGSAQT